MKQLLKWISLLLAVFCLCGAVACVNTEDDTEANEVIVGVQQDFGNLDPHEAEAAGTKEVLFNIFEGLVKCDVDGNFNPCIAQSYEISDDYLIYEFILRQDVVFHNEKKLTMDDVLYSLNRAIEKEDSNHPLQNITKVEAVDEKTLRLSLKEADTDLLTFLNCAIVPCDYDKQSTNPVGTGPFKFTEYVPGEYLVIEKNDTYFLTDKQAKLDKVTFKIVASVDAAFLELKTGSIHIFPYLTADKTEQLTDSYEVLGGNQNLLQMMALNNTEAPFDDVRVRQAVNYAVDKESIIQLTSYGYGASLGTSMSPKSAKKWYNTQTDSVYTQNQAKAKELLKEAGYENGLEFTISVPSNYQFHVDTAQAIAAQLKEVGITAKIELVEWATWLETVYAGRQYQATIIGLTAELSPRDAVSRYESTASNNFMNYNNADFDSTYQLAITETDETKKLQHYQALQMYLTQDAAAVFIQDPDLLVAVKKNIGGYQMYPYYVQDMSTVYFKEG